MTSPARSLATYLGRQEGELVVSHQPLEVGLLASDQVLRVVPVYGYPVTTPVHCDVRGEPTSVHSPHVVVALNEGAIKTLLLDKPGEGEVHP